MEDDREKIVYTRGELRGFTLDDIINVTEEVDSGRAELAEGLAEQISGIIREKIGADPSQLDESARIRALYYILDCQPDGTPDELLDYCEMLLRGSYKVNINNPGVFHIELGHLERALEIYNQRAFFVVYQIMQTGMIAFPDKAFLKISNDIMRYLDVFKGHSVFDLMSIDIMLLMGRCGVDHNNPCWNKIVEYLETPGTREYHHIQSRFLDSAFRTKLSDKAINFLSSFEFDDERIELQTRTLDERISEFVVSTQTIEHIVEDKDLAPFNRILELFDIKYFNDSVEQDEDQRDVRLDEIQKSIRKMIEENPSNYYFLMNIWAEKPDLFTPISSDQSGDYHSFVAKILYCELCSSVRLEGSGWEEEV